LLKLPFFPYSLRIYGNINSSKTTGNEK